MARRMGHLAALLRLSSAASTGLLPSCLSYSTMMSSVLMNSVAVVVVVAFAAVAASYSPRLHSPIERALAEAPLRTPARSFRPADRCLVLVLWTCRLNPLLVFPPPSYRIMKCL